VVGQGEGTVGRNGGKVEAGAVQPPAAGGSGESVGAALLKSLLVLGLSLVGFLLVPDRLFSYLALHVSPRARDLLVLLWVVVFFVFLTWLFVKIQPESTSE
jgi:hypothetical protein